MQARAPTLVELQELFWNLVTCAGPTRAAAATYQLDADEIALLVPPSERLTSFGRLDVYSEAYFFRLLEVLGEQHPGVIRIVGNDTFVELVRTYLRTSPPRGHDIGTAGELFPDFVRVSHHARSAPFLYDVARIERLSVELYTAASVCPLALARVASASAEQLVSLRLQTIPACAIVSSPFAIDELWHALLDDGELAPAPRSRPTWLLVWRPDLEVKVRRLDEDEAHLLRLAESGASVHELVDLLARCAVPDHAPERLFELINRWIDDGVLRDLA